MAGLGSDKLIEIKFDEKQLRRIEVMLRGIPNKMPQIISRAINKTAGPAKTEISKGIREEINATAKRVKERLILKKATYQNWFASIHISRRRLPLMAFAAKGPSKKAKNPAPGVSYKIKKSGGRNRITNAFIATVKAKSKTGDVSEHEGVFKRKENTHRVKRKSKTGKGHYWTELPIVELFGPSIGEVFTRSESLIQRITAQAYTRLEHNINSQIQYVLDQRKLGKTG